MTAKEVVPLHGGLRSLSLSYHCNISIALAAAVCLHLLVIIMYYLTHDTTGENVVVRPKVPIVLYPSAIDVIEINKWRGSSGPSLPKSNPVLPFGNPIPTPIPIVEPEFQPPKVFHVSADESLTSGSEGDGEDGGAGMGEQDYSQIPPDAEPPIDTFFIVEKLPVPVRQVSPEYPEVARHAGLEGAVWVKMLVDKQGRVKRSVVFKSDNEAFDDNVLDASRY
ncbi:MAG: TonB family protein [Ignavibacteriae bacterium]|nr:TonB family protein [Ignavibacteriota bacterium]